MQSVSFTLPMCYEYQGETIYVRSCYSEYYETIVSVLVGNALDPLRINYITVTGTPGIGKSIFYIYFFQRWMRENLASVIVTASFTKDRTLKSCRVFMNSLSEGEKMSTIPDIDGALYLYDGAPTAVPGWTYMVKTHRSRRQPYNTIHATLGTGRITRSCIIVRSSFLARDSKRY